MFASILSPESDSLQKSSWSKFESCTGITIKYEGSNDFESQLPVRVQGGTQSDLAIIPQPGLLAQMVKTGKVVEAAGADGHQRERVERGLEDLRVGQRHLLRGPMSANMKSLVWYSPKTFTADGYTVPTTWADLMALSQKMVTDGKVKPWCGGISSGTATGWPATDWLEEAVLGTYGGAIYDQWVAHTVKFQDPKIEAAMKTVADYMQNPAYVNAGFGDVKTIATTTFQDAGLPILKGQCGMLQQASFYEAQWPKGTVVSPTGDAFAFYLPAVDPSVTTPVEGGGEFVTAFSNAPAVQAVQNYLSTADWANSRIAVAPGWVSANQKVDQTLYTDPIDKLSAQYLTRSDATFRFDASDLMPAAVGSGAEWTAMTEWFGQGKSIDAVAKEIDAAWPS